MRQTDRQTEKNKNKNKREDYGKKKTPCPDGSGDVRRLEVNYSRWCSGPLGKNILRPHRFLHIQIGVIQVRALVRVAIR